MDKNLSFTDFKEKVKNNVDIVNVVSEYVELEKTGNNYRALCPFHQENTPSFTINPGEQFFYCFGCNTGGDVFSFIMEIENITFKESLKILAEKAGLELPSKKQNKYHKKVDRKRDKLFEINNISAKFYHYILLNKKVGEPALEYLQKRGYNKEYINKFKLGYAPDSWKALFKFLLKKGYKKNELVEAGIVQNKNENYYDRFRNRIIFPIFNVRDEVIAFGARLLNNSESSMPKYLNSPGTPIYNKGNNLYGLNWAKKNIRLSKEAVIMEGYTDVLTAHKAGLDNAVASLGTSLTFKQARLLKRYAETIYIAYDADAAGENATLRGLDILDNAGLQVKVVQLPSEKDPDDYIQQAGKEKFEKLQSEALCLMDFKIEQIIKDENIESPDSKISLSRKLVKLLIENEDAIARDVYIKNIAARLGIEEEAIKQELRKIEKMDKKKDKRNNNNNNINKTGNENSIIKIQKNILQAYINNEEYRSRIEVELNSDYFQGVYKKAWEWLLGNNKEDISSEIRNIEEEETKKLLMSLLVENSAEEINFSRLDNWINRVRENVCYRYKKKLLKKLKKNKEIELSTLNKLLIKYKILLSQKGGYVNDR